ncbi:BACON domain-containing protein [Chitinophaga sp. MM2321]|uniref:BACON domain-containing protein n=1 Tax=Chitinophaga sp. MM2321 TaxID=3137178 RepID=UPI0032D57D41
MITGTTIRTISTLFIMAIIIVFSSCRKDEMPAKPQPSPFTASIDGSTTFPATGGTANIVISAGADGWWVTVPATEKSWCVIKKIYGSGDFTVPVTIAENTTGTARRVAVTVSPTFGLPPVELVFEQQ